MNIANNASAISSTQNQANANTAGVSTNASGITNNAAEIVDLIATTDDLQNAVNTLATLINVYAAQIDANTDAIDAMDGTSIGQMNYWNGSSWVPVPAPPSGDAYLRLIGGIPIWVVE